MTGPEASLARLRQTLRTAPQRQAEIREAAASEVITVTSADGRVTVTASGLGVITQIRFSAGSRHGTDSASLAARVAEAVNAALDRAEEFQRAQRRGRGPDPRADGGEALEMFSARMRALLGRLDDIDRTLDGIAEGIADDLGRIRRDMQDLSDTEP